jgi:hypothetical protein
MKVAADNYSVTMASWLRRQGRVSWLRDALIIYCLFFVALVAFGPIQGGTLVAVVDVAGCLPPLLAGVLGLAAGMPDQRDTDGSMPWLLIGVAVWPGVVGEVIRPSTTSPGRATLFQSLAKDYADSKHEGRSRRLITTAWQLC